MAPEMEHGIAEPHRQQQLYWREMIELKVAAAYIRRYRDDVGTWMTRLDTLKAIASSGGIAAWAIWRQYAFVWGTIIALSQVADALKEVFPFAKVHKAAGDHSAALSSMLIDAQLEWENISCGQYTEQQISIRRHKLMKPQLDAERKAFPNGLGGNDRLFADAQAEAKEYFAVMYGIK